MKKITLKPVTVPLPRDMSHEVRMSVAKAEEAMRENNRLIEEAIYQQSDEFAEDIKRNIEEVDADLHELEQYVSGMNSRIVPPGLIDMNNATPLLRYEWNNAASGYCKLFERANTGISDVWEVRDEVAFRIIVHGSNIDAVYDVYVNYRGGLTLHPDIYVYCRTRSTSASTTGIRYLRSLYPVALNSGKPWTLEYSPYNGTARYLTIEVYKTTPNITWYTQRTASEYSTTYWSQTTLSLYDRRGWVSLNTIYATANAASSATYITTYLPKFMNGTMPQSGASVAANALAFVSGGKYYNTAATNKPIDMMAGVALLTTGYAANKAIAYTALRQKGVWTALQGDGVMTHDTLTLGDQVYLKCTAPDASGNVFSLNHLTNAMTAGYTWIHIGTASSNTAVLLDTCGKHFYTLDANGKLTHIDGLEIA